MPQKETASSYWLGKTQEQLSKTNYSVHLTPPLTQRLSELGDCIPGFLNSNFKQALGFLLGLQALESSLLLNPVCLVCSYYLFQCLLWLWFLWPICSTSPLENNSAITQEQEAAGRLPCTSRFTWSMCSQRAGEDCPFSTDLQEEPCASS